MIPLDVQYIVSYIVASLSVALVLFVCRGVYKWVGKVNESLDQHLLLLSVLREQIDGHVHSPVLHSNGHRGRGRSVVPS